MQKLEGDVRLLGQLGVGSELRDHHYPRFLTSRDRRYELKRFTQESKMKKERSTKESFFRCRCRWLATKSIIGPRTQTHNRLPPSQILSFTFSPFLHLSSPVYLADLLRRCLCFLSLCFGKSLSLARINQSESLFKCRSQTVLNELSSCQRARASFPPRQVKTDMSKSLIKLHQNLLRKARQLPLPSTCTSTSKVLLLGLLGLPLCSSSSPNGYREKCVKK